MNIPDKSYMDPRVEIRHSDIEGSGSFALSPIKEGETVIIWGGGVIVTNEEFEQGFKDGLYQAETAIHYDENHKWAGLATVTDTEDPYLNHSCDPNLWFAGGWPLVARRDIAAGEELTFDYATGETYPLHSACMCGSAICRHTITGQEWKDPAFQAKYKDHFNPYIQGLIEKYK